MEKVKQAPEFITQLLPPQGVICVAYADGKIWREYYAGNIVQYNKAIAKLIAANKYDIYVCTSTLKTAKRKGSNVLNRLTVCHDVDLYDDKTKEEMLKQVNDVATQLKWPLPMVIDSGNGLHVYNIFQSPLTPDVWQTYRDIYREHIINNNVDMCKDMTTLKDIVRVLRVPGSTNYKDPANPKPVEIIQASAGFVKVTGTSLQPRHFASVTPIKKVSSLTNVSINPVPHAKMLTRCGVLKDMRENPQQHQSYGLWIDALNLMVYAEDRHEAAIELSKGYKALNTDGTEVAYDEAETIKKVDSLYAAHTNMSGPTRCDTMARHKPDICAKCIYNGQINSPIMLPYTPDLTQEHSLPEGYSIGKKGLYAEQKTGGKKLVAHSVPFITKAIQDLDGNTYIEFSAETPFGRKIAMVPMKSFGRSTDLIQALSEKGIMVANANLLIAYVSAVLDVFIKEKGITPIHNKLGWTKDNTFVLPEGVVHKDSIRPSMLTPRAKSFDRNLETKGKMEAWVKGIPEKLVALLPLSAPSLFALCVGIGTPMLNAYSKQAGSIVMLCGDTGTGKSVTARMVHSVWGKPTENVIGLSDTLLSRYEFIKVYANLPVTMDELTEMKEADFIKFVYDVSQGRARSRLTKEAVLTDASNLTWSTILFGTSNKSVIDTLSHTKGANETPLYSRILELDIESFGTQEDMRHIVETMTDNYGLLREYLARYYVQNIELLTKEMKGVEKSLVTLFEGKGYDITSLRFNIRVLLCAYMGAKALSTLLPVLNPKMITALGMTLISKYTKKAQSGLTVSPVEIVNNFLKSKMDTVAFMRSLDSGHYVPAMMRTGAMSQQDIAAKFISAKKMPVISTALKTNGTIVAVNRMVFAEYCKEKGYYTSNVYAALIKAGIAHKTYASHRVNFMLSIAEAPEELKTSLTSCIMLSFEALNSSILPTGS